MHSSRPSMKSAERQWGSRLASFVRRSSLSWRTQQGTAPGRQSLATGAAPQRSTDDVALLVAGVAWELKMGCTNRQGINMVFSEFLAKTLDGLRGSGSVPPAVAQRCQALQRDAQRYGALSVEERRAMLTGMEPLLRQCQLPMHEQQTAPRQEQQGPRAPALAHRQRALRQAAREGTSASALGPPAATPTTTTSSSSSSSSSSSRAAPAAPSPPAAQAAAPAAEAAAVEAAPPSRRAFSDLSSQTLAEQLATPFTPPHYSRLVPIVFDLETTEVNIKRAHPVEIAARCLLSGEEFSRRLRLPPGGAMSTGATTVTGLTTEMCSDPALPTFEEGYTAWLAWLDERLQAAGPGSVPALMGHNVERYDIPVLLHRARATGLPLLRDARIYDTLVLARKVHPNRGNHKLQSLYPQYAGKEAEVAHRAMADVHANIVVLQGLLADIGMQGKPYEEVLQRQQCATMEWVGFMLPAAGQAGGTAGKPVGRARPAEVGRKTFGLGLAWESLAGAEEGEGGVGLSLPPEEEASPLSSTDDFSLSAWSADDPLTAVEAEAQAAETPQPSFEELVGLRASWKELAARAASAAPAFLATPLAELPSKAAFTPKQLKSCASAGFSSLQDVVHNYPRGFRVATPGRLPDPGEPAEQSVCLVARLKSCKVYVYGYKGSKLVAVFEVAHPQEAEVEAPNLAPDAYAGRRATVVLERYRKGPQARFLTTTEHRLRELTSAGGGFVAISGSVLPREAQPSPDSWTIKEATLSVSPLSDVVEVFGRGAASIDTMYAAKGEVDSRTLGTLVAKAIKVMEASPTRWADPLPDWMLRQFKLCGYLEAIQAMHSPGSEREYERGRRRLAFQELLLLQLKLLMQRQLLRLPQREADLAGVSVGDYSLVDLAKRALRFELTPAQRRAVAHVLGEMAEWPPMLCLLQGDVGCGKTVVALLAVLAAVGSGYQAAVMAPTEILAEQHHRSLARLLGDLNRRATEEGLRGLRLPTVALVTGSARAAERARVSAGLLDGSIDVAIGTHALLSESTQFERLGLAVIDEQHKFGVEQRAALVAKSCPPPHVLSMTATPIPRSAALVLHGEMSQVTIDELPPGRRPITTRVLIDGEEARQEMYDHMRREMASGGQVYIVCPLVEASRDGEVKAATEEAERLVADGILGQGQCGLLHGRLRPEEKEAALAAFSAGTTPVLISTTVVEVGVDVPAASLMIVEHADRFGLAQLHQLRGRVGRGSRDSACYLVTGRGEAEKLRVLEATSNGFEVADADFRLRGAGELLGKKQSGRDSLSGMKAVQLPQDGPLLDRAREAAALFMAAHREGPGSWPPALLAAVMAKDTASLDLMSLPSIDT